MPAAPGVRALRLAALLASAASLFVVTAPFSWVWLHPFCLVPALLALDPAGTPRDHARWGWLFGFVSVSVIFHWIAGVITTFTPIPFLGAAAIVLLFAAVYGAPNAILFASVHPLRRRLGWGWVFALPAVVVLVEIVSRYVLLFPYQHGAAWYRNPWVVQLAAVTGVSGISFLIWSCNAAIAEIVLHWRAERRLAWQPTLIVAVLVAATLGYGAARHARIEAALAQAPVLVVAQLQSDRDMDHRMNVPGSHRAGFEEWLGMTNAIEPGAVDLVVWSEGSTPYNLDSGRAADAVAAMAKKVNAEILVGGGSRRRPADELDAGKPHVFNSVFHFRADGSVSGLYDKMVPLPFGEVMPFRNLIPGFDSLADVLGIGDFRAGSAPVTLAGKHVTYATPICYEAILPQVTRQFSDADLLVNVTNDGWFGAISSAQHAMLAAMRATELGRPMVRSAYCGVSFIVEPHGDIRYETEYGKHVLRAMQVRLGRFDTPYRRFGDWFSALCLLGLAVSLAVSSRYSTPNVKRISSSNNRVDPS